MNDDASNADGDTPGRSEQEQAERETRQTGGDAPAAGSIDEREAVAEDSDDLFESSDGDDEGDGDDSGGS